MTNTFTSGKTLSEGESATLRLKSGTIVIKCLKIEPDSVLVGVEGEGTPPVASSFVSHPVENTLTPSAPSRSLFWPALRNRMAHRAQLVCEHLEKISRQA